MKEYYLRALEFNIDQINYLRKELRDCSDQHKRSRIQNFLALLEKRIRIDRLEIRLDDLREELSSLLKHPCFSNSSILTSKYEIVYESYKLTLDLFYSLKEVNERECVRISSSYHKLDEFLLSFDERVKIAKETKLERERESQEEQALLEYEFD